MTKIRSITKEEGKRRILDFLGRVSLSVSTEKEMQHDLSICLEENHFNFKREYWLGDNGIIDFYFPDEKIGLELKIKKGSPISIFRQLERYSLSDDIESLILLTNKSMGVPKLSTGKNVILMSAGRSWL